MNPETRWPVAAGLGIDATAKIFYGDVGNAVAGLGAVPVVAIIVALRGSPNPIRAAVNFALGAQIGRAIGGVAGALLIGTAGWSVGGMLGEEMLAAIGVSNAVHPESAAARTTSPVGPVPPAGAGGHPPSS